jgi:hypothetical protein
MQRRREERIACKASVELGCVVVEREQEADLCDCSLGARSDDDRAVGKLPRLSSVSADERHLPAFATGGEPERVWTAGPERRLDHDAQTTGLA